jgi:outer membrane protein TolC
VQQVFVQDNEEVRAGQPLVKIDERETGVVQLGEAAAMSRRSAEIANARYQGGTASSLDALDAERQRLQAEQSLAQAQAQLSNDYISLQKSLGLGWQPIDWQALPSPR